METQRQFGHSAFMAKAKQDDHLSVSRTMDDIDAAIVKALEVQARLSIKDLARKVGLSSPSVGERLRRLEAIGVIRAFTVDVDPRALGYAIRALVRVRPLPGKLRLVEKLIQDEPHFTECDKVTGEEAFVARLMVRSIEELDEKLEALSDHAVTSTVIVKTTPVERRLPPF